jgi:hypothetical protein
VNPHRGGHIHRRPRRIAGPTIDVIRRLAIMTPRATVHRGATTDAILRLVAVTALRMAVAVDSPDVVVVVVIGILAMKGGIGGTIGGMIGGGTTIEVFRVPYSASISLYKIRREFRSMSAAGISSV